MARPSTGYQEFGFVKYYTALRLSSKSHLLLHFESFLGNLTPWRFSQPLSISTDATVLDAMLPFGPLRIFGKLATSLLKYFSSPRNNSRGLLTAISGRLPARPITGTGRLLRTAKRKVDRLPALVDNPHVMLFNFLVAKT